MRKILIVLPKGIGDAIQSLVGLRIIQSYFNNEEIVVVVDTSLLKLMTEYFLNTTFVSNLELFDDLDFFIIIDFNGLPYFRDKLSKYKFDFLVCHTCFTDSNLKSGVDCIYLNAKPVKDTPFFDLNGKTPTFALTLYSRMANLAIESVGGSPSLGFSPPLLISNSTHRRYSKLKYKKNIAIFPGGSSIDKHWPIVKYVKLINLL